MFDLFRMELFKLRKHKLTWGAAIVCFVVTFVLPLIGKLFADILYNIVKDSGEAQAVAEAKNLVDAFNSPLEFSSLLKMPFGLIVEPAFASSFCAFVMRALFSPYTILMNFATILHPPFYSLIIVAGA